MKLHKRIIGEGKNVLILHGLFGSSDNWHTFGKKLAAEGYRVIMTDLRNHGLSPHDEIFNFESMSDDIMELITDENLKSAVLMGHSLGGKTAMKFAFKYPEFVDGLIVVDIAPRYYEVHHRKILDTLLSVDLNVIKTRKEAEDILIGGISENDTRQFLLKNLFRSEADRFEWRFNLNAINHHIENVGEAVYPDSTFTVPTLFIKGEKSNYISEQDENEIFEFFNRVEIKTAPEAGHWVHAENPEWLLKNVTEFISSLNQN